MSDPLSQAAFAGQQQHQSLEQEKDHWLSVSDLMAGLMVVFLFVAVALMRDAMVERDKIKEVAIAYKENQLAIYNALMEEFGPNLRAWNAEIEKDTLTFVFNAPQTLFDDGETKLSATYRALLRSFFPRYMMVLDQFNESISEVRIEGHTSSIWNETTGDTEAYFLNMELSQERTRSVLDFVYQLPNVGPYRHWIKGHMAAVGYSSAHPILNNYGD
ncbi:MAG: OmpA family protein, partial [Cellvibrionaceae bacterium]|nr:OmpA family protein [Cellvibrionaceae bacterium]